MTQRLDPHAIEFLVKQQMIGKFLKVGTSSATGIEVIALRMRFHLETDFSNFVHKSSLSESLIES